MLNMLKRKVVGDLKSNRGLFLAVWLVVMMGTMFYGAMYPAGVNMRASFDQTYRQFRYLDFEVQLVAQRRDAADIVRSIPGVTYAEGRLVIEGGLKLDPKSEYLTSLRLVSISDDREPEVNILKVVNGREIQSKGEILLLKSFADYHKIKVGDVLPVWINGKERKMRVVGMAFSPEFMVAGRSPTMPFPTLSSFGVAWMHYSELASYSGMKRKINNIAIYMNDKTYQTDEAQEDRIHQALEDKFSDDDVLSIYSRTQTASGGVVDAQVNGNFPIMAFFSGLFLFGAAVITSVLLARLVESEHQRIGTLRALGVTRKELVLHYLTFGFIIGLSGGIVGSILGYINSFWVMKLFIMNLIGGTLPNFVNVPQIPFILLGLVIVIISATLAGAYPAWRESSTPPGIALRPATPKNPNSISRVGLRFLPLPLRQAFRNLLRVPGRSIGTCLGVIVGAVMIFSSLALWDTINGSFGDFFNANDFDLQETFSQAQSARMLEKQIGKIEGVKEVQGMLTAPIEIKRKDGGEDFSTILIGVREQHPFLFLRTLEGAPVFSSTKGVWIGNNIRRVLGYDVGDILQVEFMDEDQSAPILGIVAEAMGSSVFVPSSLVEEWLPENAFLANTAMVRVENGQAAKVRGELADVPGMVAVSLTNEYKKDMESFLWYLRAGTLVFGSFGYILSLFVLFNTVNVSLHERQGELSVLRALGLTPRELAVMVTSELMIMVALGGVIGVPLGRAAGFWLNHTYDTDFFGQINQLHNISYVIGLVSMIVIVLLAEIPGLRSVRKTDLGQVSKSQSI